MPDQIRLLNPPTDSAQISSHKTFLTKFNVEEEYSEIPKRIKELSESLLGEAIVIMKLYGKQLQETCDAALVLSFYKILNSFIKEVKVNDFGIIEKWQLTLLRKYLDHIVMFSLVWAVGGTLGDKQSRLNFDKWLRTKWSSVSSVEIPAQIGGQAVTVFDLELVYKPYSEVREEVAKLETPDEYIDACTI